MENTMKNVNVEHQKLRHEFQPRLKMRIIIKTCRNIVFSGHKLQDVREMFRNTIITFRYVFYKR